MGLEIVSPTKLCAQPAACTQGSDKDASNDSDKGMTLTRE